MRWLHRHVSLSARGVGGYVVNKNSTLRSADYHNWAEFAADGRWHVAGSWLDAVDVNVPSPESLFRHALYGNGFFRKEFGKVSIRSITVADGEITLDVESRLGEKAGEG